MYYRLRGVFVHLRGIEKADQPYGLAGRPHSLVGRKPLCGVLGLQREGAVDGCA
jgi:hypothetical protein